jgi:hypothetical protein
VLLLPLVRREGGWSPPDQFAADWAQSESIELLWPARGLDLRAPRTRLPVNARPLAIDDSAELRQLGRLFTEDSTDYGMAAVLTAMAAALQGRIVDVVVAPSSSSFARLTRPIFSAIGVGVRTVVDVPGPALIACETAPRRITMTLPSSLTIPRHFASAALWPWRPHRHASAAPDVTYVIAVGDGQQQSLGATLSSLARQGGAAIEAVVIDDGTKDGRGLRESVRASGEFVRLIRQGPQGAIAAFNRGMREARAPYIAVIEAGTLVAKQTTRQAIELFECNNDFGAIVARDVDDSQSGPGVPATRDPFESLTFFRRSVVQSVGGFAAYPTALIEELRERGYECPPLPLT